MDNDNEPKLCEAVARLGLYDFEQRKNGRGALTDVPLETDRRFSWLLKKTFATVHRGALPPGPPARIGSNPTAHFFGRARCLAL